MAFLEKGGEWYWYKFLFSLVKLGNRLPGTAKLRIWTLRIFVFFLPSLMMFLDSC